MNHPQNSEKPAPRYPMVRAYVRGTYDIQQRRIQTGNRIVANFKYKVLGLKPGKKLKDAEKLDEKAAKKVLDTVRGVYERLTDGIANAYQVKPKHYIALGQGIIGNYTELVLVESYLRQLQQEKEHFEHLDRVLRPIPIYSEFLNTPKVPGCGPAMAGVIISEFDIRAHGAGQIGKDNLSSVAGRHNKDTLSKRAGQT